MRKERSTSQKKIIFQLLKENKNHPSVDEIFEKAKTKLPGLSRGTVYRIIKNLKEKGTVTEIPSAITRFDGNTSSHAHFICSKCGKIFDIFDACNDCNIIKKTSVKVGKINNYQIYFHGKCKSCR